MNFGKAIEAMTQGEAVYRDGWNGKGMFVVRQIPANIGKDVIPTMQSLPQKAKDIIMERENPHIAYTNQMLIILPDGTANSWLPSSSDVFANDWQVVGKEETFLTRLKQEEGDLYARKEKLGDFIDSEKFNDVSEKQKGLLKKQYDLMCEYGKVLSQRITDLEES